MTVRYLQSDDELLYLKKLYSEGCKSLGLKVSIAPKVDEVKSPQNESTFTRGDFVDGYCYVDEYYDRRKRGGNKTNEDNGGFPIIINVPVLFDLDTMLELDLLEEGHLVRILDDLPSTITTRIDFGDLIVEKSQLSYDRTYWILALYPYRNLGDSSPTPTSGELTKGDSLVKKWSVGQRG